MNPHESADSHGPGHDPGEAHAHGHDCGCDHGHHPEEDGHGHRGHDHGHGEEHGDHAHLHSHAHRHESAAEQQEWTRRFFLFLEMAVLAIWALVMVWFYASGRIAHYLTGDGIFRIQALVAGLGLFVLGVFNWLMRARSSGCGHDHGEEVGGCCGDHGHDDHGHDHDHGHDDAAHTAHSHDGTTSGRALTLVLLALPVTAAAVLTPDAWSARHSANMVEAGARRSSPAGALDDRYRLMPAAAVAAAKLAGPETASGDPAAAAPTGGVTLEMIEKYQPRNPAGNFELGVMQLYYSGSDPEYAAIMKGQGVETVGQVIVDKVNPGPGHYRIFVLQVTCCAADARPYSIPFEIDGPADLQEMGWYKVAGTLDYREERGVSTAVMSAKSVTPTIRPRDQQTMF